MPWAIKWRSENHLDGKTEYLVGPFSFSATKTPSHFDGYTKAIFRTRQIAREFATEKYGYIRRRKDLRREPHGWKTPVVVRVTVEVREAKAPDLGG